MCMALEALTCSGNDALPQHWSVLRAIHTLTTPKKYIRLLGGLSSIYSMRRCGLLSLMWVARVAFPPAAAMVGCVVFVDVGHWRLMSDRPTVGIVKIVNGSNCF